MRIRWALTGAAITIAAGVVVAVELFGHGLEALTRAECPDATAAEL